MRHIIFEQAETYPVAILIKGTYLKQHDLQRHYLDRLGTALPSDQVIAFDLAYTNAGKAPASLIKEYLDDLLPVLNDLKTEYLYCADAAYFRTLTKQSKGKADAHIGYVLPCKIKGFEHMKVIFGMNYGQLVYNPELYHRLDMTLDTLAGAVAGNHKPPGTGVIHYAHYPDSVQDIAAALESLHQYDSLSADIETFSLHPYKAGVATIGFAWDQHQGIAFNCDYRPLPKPVDGLYAENVPNKQVRYLLKRFLEQYRGRLRWHNASFDMRSLIAALWMRNPLDYKGMVEGLHVMCRLFDDTKIIAYLALNTTAELKLSLKDLAHAHGGNYAQGDDEIKDVRRIAPTEILKYNLIDCLCTNYVYDTYYPVLVRDQQEAIYTELMLPSLKVITQMELTGAPLDQGAVARLRAVLEKEVAQYEAVFTGNPIVSTFEDYMTGENWRKDFEDRKAKAKNPDKILPKDRASYPQHEFNPGSGPQLQYLLYEQLGLPVIDRTKTKLPATGGETLEKLTHHTTDPAIKAFLEALIGLAGVAKILTDFIPKFEEAIDKGDGWTYLLGSFNLGGTVSGRLSSSKPNLQNLPSGSIWGKLVKACFVAPKGWLMVGADFNSLEDYISALTTRDPNKLKVYEQGYDGHSLRAFSYFPERLPGVVNTVDSINSIKKKFEKVRDDSKGPTFALTYQGTWITLVRNLGFTEPKAKEIEKAYHKLYVVSDQWVQAKLDQAAKDGFVEVAFGLRVRTPLLAQTLRNHRATPYQAAAEGRTAGNALGQSYGLLNNRAANEFMGKVWASEYCHDIIPIMQIHDAQYYLVRDNVDAVHYANTHMIEAMQWQDLPELVHPTVKLGAELDVFWPTWADPLTIPNGASRASIAHLCATRKREHHDKLKEAA